MPERPPVNHLCSDHLRRLDAVIETLISIRYSPLGLERQCELIEQASEQVLAVGVEILSNLAPQGGTS
jgi:hypothetical protein